MQNLEDDKKLLHCIFNTKYVFEILNSKYLPLQEIKVLGLFKQILMDIFVHFLFKFFISKSFFFVHCKADNFLIFISEVADVVRYIKFFF